MYMYMHVCVCVCVVVCVLCVCVCLCVCVVVCVCVCVCVYVCVQLAESKRVGRPQGLTAQGVLSPEGKKMYDVSLLMRPKTAGKKKRIPGVKN
jgi:hypothetical protein